MRRRRQRKSVDEKAQVLQKVESSPGSKRKVLSELGVQERLLPLENQTRERKPCGSKASRPILEPPESSGGVRGPWCCLEHTDLSSRQLAAWITDNKGFSVTESTVYRILKRQARIKSPEMKMAAGKEFHTKATRPHQMWATDASYFRVCGWGFYYLVTVMDDFSRFIIAWRLQRDMTADSFIEVVQDSRSHRHD